MAALEEEDVCIIFVPSDSSTKPSIGSTLDVDDRAVDDDGGGTGG